MSGNQLASLATIPQEIRDESHIVNLGPSHPAMHGTVRLLVALDGETVRDIDVEVGFLHRGFEKMVEAGTWTQAISYTDRLNYVSPLINNVGYVGLVEKMLGIEITERCKYARVFISEISGLQTT